MLSCNLHLCLPTPIRPPSATANVLTAHNLYCISCNLHAFFRKAGGSRPVTVSRAEDQRLLEPGLPDRPVDAAPNSGRL